MCQRRRGAVRRAALERPRGRLKAQKAPRKTAESLPGVGGRCDGELHSGLGEGESHGKVLVEERRTKMPGPLSAASPVR